MAFWLDNSGRLTFDRHGVASTDYPLLCRRIADKFGLTPNGDPIIGPEQIFWDFQCGDLIIGLDWDIWMEFMAVAKSEAAEPLVHSIGNWLNSEHSVHH
ncbi:MAG: hypothetical protein ACRC8S_09680 [Fimbriiglobus sp.]